LQPSGAPSLEARKMTRNLQMPDKSMTVFFVKVNKAIGANSMLYRMIQKFIEMMLLFCRAESR
jgi:hypothetical protein